MIKRQLLVFLLRWVFSSAGMWVCLTFFATVEGAHTVWLYAAAGLIFSLVNSIVKPLVTTLSLPLIIFTMGVFTVLINIGMVALTFNFLPGVSADFWHTTLCAVVMSVINSLANLFLPDYNKE